MGIEFLKILTVALDRIPQSNQVDGDAVSFFSKLRQPIFQCIGLPESGLIVFVGQDVDQDVRPLSHKTILRKHESQNRFGTFFIRAGMDSDQQFFHEIPAVIGI